MRKLIPFIFSSLFLLSLPVNAQQKNEAKSYILLVSFDGFRHDYVTKYNAKNFKQFIAKGAAAEGLIPGFPSKTFPNHYSIITGLYPGHHGLVGNSFYDSIRNTTYSIRKRSLVEDPFYYGGTPLWQLTQENGYQSASYFWVGSEAPIKGHYPDYYFKYNGKIPNKKRIDQVIKWFQLPKSKRPRFISLYFSMVDTQGHRTGPNSAELAASVKKADDLVGYLMKKIKKLDLPIDVILTSDHGMKAVNTQNRIDPKVILDRIPSSAQVVDGQLISQVYLPDEQIDPTYKKLKPLENHFKVYKKGQMPKKWHYNSNYRIGDLVILADPGYIFSQKGGEKTIGVHGYNPYLSPEMQGILYANGPDIKKGVHTDALENVNVYPLITKILGFENPEIDGEFFKIAKFYKP